MTASFNFEKIPPVCSSDTSDSESLFDDVDVRNNESQNDDEWDIVERTLYQEPGPQVTDPELLKECKLWRDTFPYFRVTGTKIDVNKTDIVQTDQSVETANGHFDLKKLNEKRQIIKNRVVGELVERLITKFSLHKGVEGKQSTVEITEINDDDLETDSETETKPKMIRNPSPKEKVSREVRNIAKAAPSMKEELYFERKPTTNMKEESYFDRGAKTNVKEELYFERKPTTNVKEETYFDRGAKTNTKEESYFERGAKTNTKEESYFERGKSKTSEIVENVGLTREQAERGLLEILGNDRSRVDLKSYKNLPKLPENIGEKAEFTERRNFDLKNSDKQIAGKSKPKTNTAPTDSFTNMFKPFTMTSKIDKKYEGLLDRIVNRRCIRQDLKHCRTSSSGIEDSLEKLRLESGLSGGRNLPKINKLNNNWLNRAEANAFDESEEEWLERTSNIKNKKLSKELDLLREDKSEVDIDAFIENVKKGLMSNRKRQPRKSVAGEGMSLRRPKPSGLEEKAERSSKSRSCCDLPKKGKKETKGRLMKSGNEKPNESNMKTRNKFTGLGNNKGGRGIGGNKNAFLPPIESVIICTEITGHPKMSSKNVSKKF